MSEYHLAIQAAIQRHGREKVERAAMATLGYPAIMAVEMSESLKVVQSIE